MFRIGKQFFSWLLVLSLAMSPLQSVLGIDFDQISHERDCQTSQINPTTPGEIGSEDPCQLEHNNHCFNFLGCTTSVNSSSIQSKYLLQDPARNIIKLNFESNSPSLFSIYPELLNPPPIA